LEDMIMNSKKQVLKMFMLSEMFWKEFLSLLQ